MPIAVIPMAAEFHWSFVQRSLVLSSFAYGYILTQVGLGAVRVRTISLRHYGLRLGAGLGSGLRLRSRLHNRLLVDHMLLLVVGHHLGRGEG